MAETIHQRMIAVLAEMKSVGKDQTNTQQNYKFRGQEDIMNALSPLLGKHGVFIVPDVLERVEGEPRPTRSGGLLYFVSLHVRFTFFGADGDSVYATAWGEGSDSGDKATNKAMTAAFKYALVQVFAIRGADVTDADSETPEETVKTEKPSAFVKPPSTEPKADQKQKDALLAVVGELILAERITKEQVETAAGGLWPDVLDLMPAGEVVRLTERLVRFSQNVEATAA